MVNVIYNYFEIDTEDKTSLHLKFELEYFLKIQSSIYNKYKSQLDKKTLGNRMTQLDMYILQVIEEVAEAKLELPNRDNDKFILTDEFIGEVIDVVMYLGSLLSAIIEEYDYKNEERFVYVIKGYDSVPKTNLDMVKMLSNVTGMLIKERRKYPERKWHKDFKKSDINVNRESEFKLEAINTILDLLSSMVIVYGVEKVSETLSNKQNFINHVNKGTGKSI